ncbi:MAG TPA: response regulator [Gammaproteobacteria bacterium]|jgi:two-component system phosphate regulon response regulator PhoB|nr:response regulator [Xanthomonadales bacterium]MCB1593980.1 response regulator [Xanthomonadales bacterium]HOP22576.1 response regulator [Gammaproteobacteria bacterium]HPQ86798.1 response regulator [Gammaproteobacteria bacterium]
MKNTILIIEDESAIREMLSFSLMQAGYIVIQAGSAMEALRIFDEITPDLIIVDWGLPQISGLELVKTIRETDVISEAPIIMLTARTQEHDKVRGLDYGVDDYMTKPVSVKELQARIKALLRRYKGFGKSNVIHVDDIKIDLDSHQVLIEEKDVKVSITEFNLLKLFLKNPNKLLSREQILNHVWGRNSYVEVRTVDVHILRLRKVLKKHNKDFLLKTIRGAGYKFVAEAD